MITRKVLFENIKLKNIYIINILIIKYSTMYIIIQLKDY